MNHDARRSPPACPRCGYDQSGVLASWQDACPLEGTCSECGYGFLWRDACRPDFAHLPWLPEHARSRWAWTRNVFGVWFRVARPWSFWRCVRPEHKAPPRRIALAVLATFFLLHAWCVVVVLVADLAAGNFGAHTNTVVTITAAANGQTTVFSGTANDTSDVVARTLSNAAFPILKFWPDWSNGTGYPFETWLLLRVANAYPLIVPFVICAAFPLLMLCLPVTRKRAKVRAGHLARASCYGLFPLLMLGLWRACRLGLIAGVSLGETYGQSSSRGLPDLDRGGLSFDEIGSEIPWMIAIGCGLWTILWWGFALHRGWRIDHPALVHALLTITAVLAGFTAAVICP